MDNPPPYTPYPPPSPPKTKADLEGSDSAQTHVYPMQTLPPSGYNSTDNAIMTQPQSITTLLGDEEEYPSNTAAVIVSGVVCCCFCCLLGFIGLLFAVQAPSSHTADDARRKIRTAYTLSFAGLIIGCLLYIIGSIVHVTIDVNKHHIHV